ncbi:hypothetical protein KY341_06365, partial [Candidatus Woesearchaeota archaeon]|nr:hypothetical protein [Candidatus Woesearchaeota archaeon]
AKRNYNIKNYADANNLCKQTLRDAELAFDLNDRIASIKKAYAELETDIPEIKELIQLMQEAFEREDFVLANTRAEQAEFLLSLKEKEIQQTLPYKWGLVRKYWVQITGVLIMLIIIGIFAYSSTNLKAVTKRIKNLEKHHGAVHNKIKEAQHKYFVKKALPSRLYKKEMEHHRNSLADIEKKKHELKIKRLKIISGRRLKDLEKTRQEADESKKELHRKYYVHKTIDKQTFHKLKLGFDKIIQDIEKRIELKKK